MKIFFTVLLLILLSGCATNGPKIESAQIDTLRKGQTPAAEIFKQFGRPNVLSKNMDGTQTAVYVHTGSGSLLSESAETVTFYFDNAGVLADFKHTLPTAEKKSAPEAALQSASPAPQSPAAQTGIAKKAATSDSVAPAADPAPAPAKSGTPYLWDILRSSTAKDPRNQ